jgi:hypothetical protein
MTTNDGSPTEFASATPTSIPMTTTFKKNSQRCFDHLLAHLVAYGQIEPSDVYDVTSITINSSGTLEWVGKVPSQLEDGNATAA